MARTIYFNDGSREVLLCGDNEKQELERVLRERLGDDTAELCAILGFTQKLNCQKITASIERLIKAINSIL